MAPARTMVDSQPEIVFTTAHALAAFEVGALDYLLKPFGRQRFQTMLERVRQRLYQDIVLAAERARSAFGTPLRRLFARTRDAIVPIDVRTIHHLQASGDYVEVFCESGRYLLQTSLGELAESLDPELFVQVHRSHMVNLEAVELLRGLRGQPCGRGSGERLAVPVPPRRHHGPPDR